MVSGSHTVKVLRPVIVLMVGFALLVTLEKPGIAWQGKLSQIKTQVSSPKKKEKQKKHRDSDCDDHDDQDDGSILGDILFSIFFSKNDHHHAVPGSGYQTLPPVATPGILFADYPYAEGYDGFLMHEDFVPVVPSTGSIRGAFLYGTDFDNIHRWTSKFLVETNGFLGGDLEWTYLTESTGPGTSDELHLGDANILGRLISSPKFETRLGIGMGWLVAGSQTDLGFNGTMQMDFYPAEPLVISTELDLGGLGNAFSTHLNATAGIMLRNAELQVGYDYRRIGTVDLSGPSLGIRFWR